MHLCVRRLKLQAKNASLGSPHGFPTADDESRLLRKQDARIIPLSAAIYFLCFLDRANMGNAKILNSTTHDDMQRSLGMTDHQFVVALMVFLVAYAAFEVPSNMLLKKLRPSRWLAFLMFCWGATTVSLGGTRSVAAATAVRFLLGMFEAGLFPGLVYYLTFWYRHDERSVRWVGLRSLYLSARLTRERGAPIKNCIYPGIGDAGRCCKKTPWLKMT